MYNFLIDKLIIFAGMAIAAYIFRDGRELYALMFVLVVLGLLVLKSYQEYLLIHHIKARHSKFYEKYADKIGFKGWIGNLRSELIDLEDEYINNYIEHPIEINLTPPRTDNDEHNSNEARR